MTRRRHLLRPILLLILVPTGLSCQVVNVLSPPPPWSKMHAAAAAPPVEKPEESYLPLRARGLWEYEAMYRVFPLGRKKGKATVRSEGLVTIGDRTYHKMTTEVRGTPLEIPITTYLRRDGNRLVALYKGPSDKESLVLTFPLKVGDRWTTRNDKGEVNCAIVAEEDVVCPDRTYPKCLKMTIEAGSALGRMKETQWLARGVGMVKQTVESKLLSAELLLTKFESKPPDPPKADRP